MDRSTSVVLPPDALRTPDGAPAVLLTRTTAGWTVLQPPAGGGRSAAAEGDAGLPLVEAMTLADLVAGELGVHPEPNRQARRAARSGATAESPEEGAESEQLQALRRTVAQLEHALAARVSIERAIGVLAERHDTPPRQAFERLRQQARNSGRSAADLAVEVLDSLAPPAPGPTTGRRGADDERAARSEGLLGSAGGDGTPPGAPS
ncbi:ANTAR domain-containing protein [Modestobacter roseus]|uniref:ANTAR domain-containing protein n=1 Tax=Modestobacter roseus TaxID=1181884 RepID=UPI001294E15F|nr:ANTAR domain-containing protein [Modestobacter roseus]MQA35024.1 ANTAR domain-containing protein [Modestobacter roseus]